MPVRESLKEMNSLPQVTKLPSVVKIYEEKQVHLSTRAIWVQV